MLASRLFVYPFFQFELEDMLVTRFYERIPKGRNIIVWYSELSTKSMYLSKVELAPGVHSWWNVLCKDFMVLKVSNKEEFMILKVSNHQLLCFLLLVTAFGMLFIFTIVSPSMASDLNRK